MKKVLALILVLLLTWTIQSFPAELMLPFSGGQTWSCDQGNYNDPGNQMGWFCYSDEDGDGDIDGTYNSNMLCTTDSPDRKWQWSNPTHRDGTKLNYAWDFNMGSTSDLGLPVQSPADGTIVYAKNSNTGWGNTIIIDYGDGTFGKLAHLQLINVSEGQNVSQGQQVGTCGGTPYWSPHIHYQTQRSKEITEQAIKSTFIDAEEADFIPKEGGKYTSLNTHNPYNNFKVGMFYDGWKIEPWGTSFGGIFVPYSRPFVITYFHEGGLNLLGHPANEVRKGTVYEFPGYHAEMGIDLPYIQDIQNTSGGSPWLTLVLNPYKLNLRMGYLGIVFPINGRIRDYWKAYYSQLGYPVCNEYSEIVNGKEYAVQWFERGINNFLKVTYNINEGTFNDPETDYLSYGDHLNQSVWDNLGCPLGVCGVGGDGEDPNPEPYPPTPTAYTFGQAKICTNIDENWNCVDEKYIFYNIDNGVFSWVEILNLYEAIDLKWVWYSPSNNIISQIEERTDQPYEGEYIGWWRHNSWVDLSDSSERGTYMIKFYINNILTSTSFFELKEIGELLLPPAGLIIN
ncbi:MAG: M23 family metallopeptidase [Patescibacteria group bacterium]|jgi:hypothetical protein|nr:M23 family metallopeptidase [Patescibacteria group bacterium]